MDEDLDPEELAVLQIISGQARLLPGSVLYLVEGESSTVAARQVPQQRH